MTDPTEHYADVDGTHDVPADPPAVSALPTPCPVHGLMVLDQAGRCMPSCGHGWTAEEMAGVIKAVLPSPPASPAPDPHEHFADWLVRWFDLHTGTFGRCRNELSHECAGMLAGDMHAAGFAVVRLDDLQTGVRIDEWGNAPDAVYDAIDVADREVAAENQKMAEQQEHERGRR